MTSSDGATAAAAAASSASAAAAAAAVARASACRTCSSRRGRPGLLWGASSVFCILCSRIQRHPRAALRRVWQGRVVLCSIAGPGRNGCAVMPLCGPNSAAVPASVCAFWVGCE
jgi:hypothetical protein